MSGGRGDLSVRTLGRGGGRTISSGVAWLQRRRASPRGTTGSRLGGSAGPSSAAGGLADGVHVAGAGRPPRAQHAGRATHGRNHDADAAGAVAGSRAGRERWSRTDRRRRGPRRQRLQVDAEQLHREPAEARRGGVGRRCAIGVVSTRDSRSSRATRERSSARNRSRARARPGPSRQRGSVPARRAARSRRTSRPRR